MEAQSDGQLNRVEGPQMTTHPVLADKGTGKLIMRIEDPDGPYDVPLDICQELAPESRECGSRKDPGAHLPSESREHLDCCEP